MTAAPALFLAATLAPLTATLGCLVAVRRPAMVAQHDVFNLAALALPGALV